jgi:O-antigen/teichoic acid export membrane protein
MNIQREKMKIGIDLTQRTTGNMVWLVFVRLLSKSIDFSTLLVLAKLISPHDFGVIAVAMTLILVIEAIFELPISQALITIKDVSKNHIDTAFTLSALRGIGLAVVLWLLAIPFAYFYQDTRIAPLIETLSLAPVLRGMMSPRMSIFLKRLDFRRELVLDLSAKVVTFLYSSFAAWLLRDYRALAVGILASPFTLMSLSYVLAPYRPKLSLRGWGAFSSFFGWTTMTQLLSAINWQCDRLLLGPFISRSQLGTYSLANDISYIPEQALIKPILRPMLSAFSIIGNDHARLSSAYAKASSSILGLGLPVMLGLSLLADPAVHFLLGSKWIVAIPALRWLSLTLIPPLFTSPFPSLAMAKGRFEIIFRQTLIEAMSKIPLMTLGAVLFGVNGAIAARALSAVLTASSVLFYVYKLTGTNAYRQVLSAWRVVVSGGVLVTILLLLRPALYGRTGRLLGVGLAAVSLAGLGSYVASVLLLWAIAGRPLGFEQIALQRFYTITLRAKSMFATG